VGLRLAGLTHSRLDPLRGYRSQRGAIGPIPVCKRPGGPAGPSQGEVQDEVRNEVQDEVQDEPDRGHSLGSIRPRLWLETTATTSRTTGGQTALPICKKQRVRDPCQG